MPMTWDDWPENARNIFQLMRSEAGEEIVLDKNIFVERILLNDSASGFSEEEKAEYIRPFKNAGEDRRPTLTWPRQIPIDGSPLEVIDEVEKNIQDLVRETIDFFDFKKLATVMLVKSISSSIIFCVK